MKPLAQGLHFSEGSGSDRSSCCCYWWPHHYYLLGAQPRGDLNSTCGNHGHSHRRRVAGPGRTQSRRRGRNMELFRSVIFRAPTDLCHQLISINQPPWIPVSQPHLESSLPSEHAMCFAHTWNSPSVFWTMQTLLPHKCSAQTIPPPRSPPSPPPHIQA